MQNTQCTLLTFSWIYETSSDAYLLRAMAGTCHRGSRLARRPTKWLLRSPSSGSRQGHRIREQIEDDKLLVRLFG